MLQTSHLLLQRNHDYRNYIRAVDSVVKRSDELSRQREQTYLKGLSKLDKTIEKLKTELSTQNNKLPKLEDDHLSPSPN